MIEAGWRAAYGESVEAATQAPDDAAAPAAKGDDEAEQALPALTVGQEVSCLVRRGARQAHQAAGPLLGGHAAAGHGDRRQAGRRRRGRRGHEGRRHRHAGHPRRHHRAPGRRRVRRARGPQPARHREGRRPDQDARRPRADEPELTGRWEQRLNRIERGEEQAQEFRDEIDGFTREVVAWFADKERGDLRDRARRRSRPAPPRAARARSSSTPRATAATRTTARTTRAAATRSGSSRTGARSRATRRSSTSPPGARARTSRASARSSAPAPPPAAAARSSSARAATAARAGRAAPRPGCGYVIWKKVRGQKGEVDAETARQMVAARRDQRGAGRRQGADRRLPHARLRRPDRREQPRLRLHELEEPQEPRLRLRHLEAREGPRGDPRGGHRAPRGGPRGGRRRSPRWPRPRDEPGGGAPRSSPSARTWGYSRSSGPGGQRRDKTETRAELTVRRGRPGRPPRARSPRACARPWASTSGRCGSPARPSARASATARW